LSIWTLSRGAVPGRSWGERPLPMLLEVLRFFLEPPDERWGEIGPAVQVLEPLGLLATTAGGQPDA
jgi:hypothetical protein